MKKIAVYGKGGIGKSTIVSNMSRALTEKGYTVIQIGCDPKADSTLALRGGKSLHTVLETMRTKGNDFSLADVTMVSDSGVVCVEAGGPLPGQGCAGRGIITALEKLNAKGLYETYNPDYVFYDVLGDVVCGGFSMPMRSGYADEVYIVTSGENMAIYAAANIATAVSHFKGRGYAALGGIILNHRNVKRETEKVQELCQDFDTSIVGEIPWSDLVQEAEEAHTTVQDLFPDSEQASCYRILADRIRGELDA